MHTPLSKVLLNMTAKLGLISFKIKNNKAPLKISLIMQDLAARPIRFKEHN